MSDKNYKFCPKCGQELPKEMNYCNICGFKQPDADSSNNVEENEVHNQSSPSPEPNHHNMKTAIISLWNNMFFIGGKANRAEFWYGYLDLAIINFIIFFVWGMMIDFADSAQLLTNILVAIVYAFTSIAYFTSSVRRLHDINKKGHFLWLLLIPIVGPIIIIVFLASKSVKNERFNRKLQKPWNKEIWTWAVLFLVAFCSFGFFNSYTKAMENYSYDNASSNDNNSDDNDTDQDDTDDSDDNNDVDDETDDGDYDIDSVRGISSTDYDEYDADENTPEISYGQLMKSDKYFGKSYNLSNATVLQASEADDESSTTLLVYDNGDTNKLFQVYYPGTTKAVEDNVVNVKGILGKTQDYDTKAGGSNTVPTMVANKVTYVSDGNSEY